MKTDIWPPEAPIDCSLCPRLVAFRRDNKARYPDYFNGAVPSWGDAEARLLVVGMAPGLHGANATGRPFTGDGAGEFLYKALAEHGFSTGEYAKSADDGLVLDRAMITNVVRCVPPKNKPTGTEATTCRPYLISRVDALPRLRVMLTLGKIAHDSTLRAMGVRLKAMPFGHGREYDLRPGVKLVSCYHTSRYNVNTRVLTWAMFDALFGRLREIVDAP